MTSSRTEDFVRRLSDPDPAVAALVEDPDEITTRILRAAIEQAELLGMRRSTMEDVAKRSGVGRATLYRRFPTKAALNDAIVLSEVRRFLEGSAQARAQGTTFEDRMVYDTVFTVTFIRQHALLKKLLRTEPEAILPSLTVDAGAIIDFATDYTVALFRRELYGPKAITAAQERHLRTAAELQTRLTLSFIVTPHTGINLASLDDTRAYVRRYLMPMVTP
ncbi:TetR/AcrR family transcriptional regulator [Mycolicibacterium mucogenicum]|uniref:TetR/AcrR family transcriptional regulator n=1 Tax=Mycolicibacterium mucogenicum TaxID=56689 RepID=A0A4V3AWV2_MYCMU|nr:TetR/AcrR family transcriptional regulator [Mycolicibacterium mucogenicum]TDK92403.1 TetR/AcrR family transcriptional regulator [Mycolicibacterium mucogenicum]